MNTARQRGIFSRLLRSVFMIFTGYFALLGILVTAFFLLIGIGVYHKLSTSDTTTTPKKAAAPAELSDALLKITVERGITSEAPNDRQRLISQLFSQDLPVSSKELETALRRAAADQRVHAVLLDFENGGTDFVTTSALRRSILEFEKSQKPIYVHLNEADTLLYYLASSGTKINLAPVSGITIPGPAFQLTYFGSALKKLGVEMEVVRAGKYKSYMEPYTLDAPSAETMEMYGAIENSLRGTLTDGIAEGRKKPKDQVTGWLKRSLFTSGQSLQQGLVDRIGYLPQWIEDIKTETKSKNVIELEKYLAGSDELDDGRKAPVMGGGSEPALALIEATGEIVMEAAGDTSGKITPKALIKELKWAREKDEIKAVVMRVDSPGGSALASDLIWDEVRKLSEKKPLIVSMGSVAASGGYYISAPATMIIAEPTTITGSIGVIGASPKGLQVSDKWGVSFHMITNSDRKNYLNFGSKSTEQDRAILGESIDETYNAFVTKVAAGRKQDPQHIFAIAQGRVYTGIEASKIGLVDKLGGLNDAMREAKVLAKLDPEKFYNLDKYEPEDESILDCFTGGNAWKCMKDLKSGAQSSIGAGSSAPFASLLKKPLETAAQMERLLNDSSVLAYWPGVVDWSPRKGR
ncbi:MAG: signal peptide peptidase SppA [Chitinophagaceae bacterium]|nr:signal peptide peptidase SppA [Oligoflexus sp.]